MTIFRKRIGSEVWHWCSNCSEWPVINYVSTSSESGTEELCAECMKMEREDTCACVQEPLCKAKAHSVSS